MRAIVKPVAVTDNQYRTVALDGGILSIADSPNGDGTTYQNDAAATC